MKIEDGIDNWTEDDFNISQVETPPLDDPWAIDARSIAASGAKSSADDSEDRASSKNLTRGKPGIYVPSVSRIRSFAPPSAHVNPDQLTPIIGPPSQLSSRASQQLGNNKDPWGFRIPSNHPPSGITGDSLRTSNEARNDVDIDWFTELEDEPIELHIDGSAQFPNPDTSTNDLPDFDYDIPNEPEITAEYEGDLYEELFKTADSMRGVNRNLKINEWLASLGQLGDETVETITNTLTNFTVRRFTHWIK